MLREFQNAAHKPLRILRSKIITFCKSLPRPLAEDLDPRPSRAEKIRITTAAYLEATFKLIPRPLMTEQSEAKNLTKSSMVRNGMSPQDGKLLGQ